MDAPTRVLKTLNHEEPDRIPAYENNFYSDTIKNHYGLKSTGSSMEYFANVSDFRMATDQMDSNRKDRKNVAQNMYQNMKFFRNVNIDIAQCMTLLLPRKIIKGGWIDEFGRILQFERYPGDGTEFIGYRGGHFKSYEDYLSWDFPDPNDEGRITGYLGGRDAQEQLNNDVFAVPGISGIFAYAWEGFGFEIFSRILSHHKQAKNIFDNMGKFAVECVKTFSEQEAGMLIIYDDFGYKKGLFMSPKRFREYIIPWIMRICKTAHKNDCKVMLHSDGDILDIFDDLVNAGIDAINPIEPTTANPQFDIFKLHKKYGDKITFSGNISPNLLTSGKISDIVSYTKKLITELGPGGGYIFSTGHSVIPSITLDRWNAVLEIRKKFGYYPIK